METSATAQTADQIDGTGDYYGMRATKLTPIQLVSSILYRQRKPILLTMAAALALGAVGTMMAPKQYTALTSVKLEQQTAQAMPVSDLDPQALARTNQDSERFLQTQIDLVRSRSVAEGVAKRLKATTDTAVLNALNMDAGSAASDIASALQDKVGVEIGMNTRVATITFTSRDAAVSARVANAFADQLIDANMAAKTDTTTRARDYLQEQLVKAKQALQDSERKLLDVARTTGLSGVVLTNNGNNDGDTLRTQQLSALTTSLAQATAKRISAEQQWYQVRNANALSLPMVAENKAIQDLQAEKARTNATLAEERERYTNEYPSETSGRAQRLDNEMFAIAGNIKRSYLDNFQAAAREEQSLQSVINGLRDAAITERQRGIEYNSLDRDVQTAKAFYDGLLQRYKEVATAAGAPSANVTIIDRAFAPDSPSSPSLAKNMALALIAGMIAAMAVALIRERKTNVIRSAIDINRLGNIPFLGVIPAPAQGKPVEDALDDPISPQSEAYYSVAVSLEQMNGGVLPKTLLVTSSSPREGKSTSSLSIARSLGRMGQRALLIDGDLRRPSIAQRLGLKEGPGLAEALAGGAKTKSVVQKSDDLGIDVITAGQNRGQSITLLARDRLAQVLQELAGDYDCVIVDGPPVLGLADAVMLSKATEMIVMVVEAGRIEGGQLTLAMSRLPNGKPLGTVLTKFDPKAAGVEYGSEMYYSY